MKLNNVQAYRLGSMPRRVHRERRQRRWPEEAPCLAAVSLIDEWAGIASELKDKPFLTELTNLREAIEIEYNNHANRMRYERLLIRYRNLTAMGEKVEPPVPPKTYELNGPGSLD
jgi:hypothetical protein